MRLWLPGAHSMSQMLKFAGRPVQAGLAKAVVRTFEVVQTPPLLVAVASPTRAPETVVALPPKKCAALTSRVNFWVKVAPSSVERCAPLHAGEHHVAVRRDEHEVDALVAARIGRDLEFPDEGEADAAVGALEERLIGDGAAGGARPMLLDDVDRPLRIGQERVVFAHEPAPLAPLLA